jgi:hypothetical protein
MANTGGGADGAAIESGRLTGWVDMVSFSYEGIACWSPPYAAIWRTSSGRVLNV